MAVVRGFLKLHARVDLFSLYRVAEAVAEATTLCTTVLERQLLTVAVAVQPTLF